MRLVTGESPGEHSSSEDFLGIKAKKASDQGALTSLSKKKGGEPSKVDQAFGSYVQFTVPATKSKCAGVISYEPQTQKPNQANIHLNTATHCFEVVNPLGLTEVPLQRSGIVVGTNAAPAEAFVRPFQANSRVKMPITFSRAEVRAKQVVIGMTVSSTKSINEFLLPSATLLAMTSHRPSSRESPPAR